MGVCRNTTLTRDEVQNLDNKLFDLKNMICHKSCISPNGRLVAIMTNPIVRFRDRRRSEYPDRGTAIRIVDTSSHSSYGSRALDLSKLDCYPELNMTPVHGCSAWKLLMNDSYLAIAVQGYVHLWRTGDGQHVSRLRHGRAQMAVEGCSPAFSLDNECIATGGADGTVEIHRLRDIDNTPYYDHTTLPHPNETCVEEDRSREALMQDDEGFWMRTDDEVFWMRTDDDV